MTSLASRLEWRRFTPHVDVHFENRDLVVKTASSLRELYAVLRFRREVFLKEYGISKVLPFAVDMDRFDLKCDQLIVQQKSTGKLIGCYRLMCSDFHEQFYSEQEFAIGHVKKLPGTKVELGRACVHPDFRNGVVMQLLWRGIADYIRQVGADYAFGCTSLKITDPALTRKIELLLTERESLVSWPKVEVKPLFRFNALERAAQSRVLGLTEADRPELAALLPPLLKFYLRIGAKLCGSPGIDRKLKCIDFFTLFNFTHLPSHMRDKYGLA